MDYGDHDRTKSRLREECGWSNCEEGLRFYERQNAEGKAQISSSPREFYRRSIMLLNQTRFCHAAGGVTAVLFIKTLIVPERSLIQSILLTCLLFLRTKREKRCNALPKQFIYPTLPTPPHPIPSPPGPRDNGKYRVSEDKCHHKYSNL